MRKKQFLGFFFALIFAANFTFASNDMQETTKPQATESIQSSEATGWTTKDTVVTGASLAVLCYLSPVCAVKVAYAASFPAYYAFMALGSFEYEKNGAIRGHKNINIVVAEWFFESAREAIGAIDDNEIIDLASDSEKLATYNYIVWQRMYASLLRR